MKYIIIIPLLFISLFISCKKKEKIIDTSWKQVVSSFGLNPKGVIYKNNLYFLNDAKALVTTIWLYRITEDGNIIDKREIKKDSLDQTYLFRNFYINNYVYSGKVDSFKFTCNGYLNTSSSLWADNKIFYNDTSTTFYQIFSENFDSITKPAVLIPYANNISETYLGLGQFNADTDPVNGNIININESTLIKYDGLLLNPISNRLIGFQNKYIIVPDYPYPVTTYLLRSDGSYQVLNHIIAPQFVLNGELYATKSGAIYKTTDLENWTFVNNYLDAVDLYLINNNIINLNGSNIYLFDISNGENLKAYDTNGIQGNEIYWIKQFNDYVYIVTNQGLFCKKLEYFN